MEERSKALKAYSRALSEMTMVTKTEDSVNVGALAMAIAIVDFMKYREVPITAETTTKIVNVLNRSVVIPKKLIVEYVKTLLYPCIVVYGDCYDGADIYSVFKKYEDYISNVKKVTYNVLVSSSINTEQITSAHNKG